MHSKSAGGDFGEPSDPQFLQMPPDRQTADVKFEYGLRLQDPLLAVGIGLDFECGLAECAFDPRDHLGDAALAFHFCLERERLLHPLQRVILLAVAVQTEDKEFSLHHLGSGRSEPASHQLAEAGRARDRHAARVDRGTVRPCRADGNPRGERRRGKKAGIPRG